MRKLLLLSGLLAITANVWAQDGISVTISPPTVRTQHDNNNHYNHDNHYNRRQCVVRDRRGHQWVKRGRRACKRAMNECRNFHDRHNRFHQGNRCFVVR